MPSGPLRLEASDDGDANATCLSKMALFQIPDLSLMLQKGLVKFHTLRLPPTSHCHRAVVHVGVEKLEAISARSVSVVQA